MGRAMKKHGGRFRVSLSKKGGWGNINVDHNGKKLVKSKVEGRDRSLKKAGHGIDGAPRKSAFTSKEGRGNLAEKKADFFWPGDEGME